MIKKLFISLIILSTLTSDGISAIPGNLSELYYCLQERHEAGGIKGISGDCLNGYGKVLSESLRGSAFFWSAPFCHMFTLSGAGIRDFFEPRAAEDFFIFLDTGSLPCLIIESSYAQFLTADKDIVFIRSDLSPPVLVM